jgi:hypothetical protein
MIGTLVFIAFWVLLLPVALILVWCQRVKSRTRARIAASQRLLTAMRADQQNAWIWKGDSRGIYGHNCPVIDLDTAGTDNPRQVYGWPDYNGLLTTPGVKKPATVDVAVVADQSGFADVIQGLDQQLVALFQTPLPDVRSGIGQPSFTCPRCGATSYNPNEVVRHMKDFRLATATKYIWRVGFGGKWDDVEDVRKAIFYLNDFIEHPPEKQ